MLTPVRGPTRADVDKQEPGMDQRPHNPSDDVWLPHEPGRPVDDPAAEAGQGPGQPATWAAPTTAPTTAAPAPSGRGRRLLAGAALATGLAVGGAAVAAAVTSGDRAAQGNVPGARAGAPQGGFLPFAGEQGDDDGGRQPGAEGFPGRGGWHHGPGDRGFGSGLGGALHGELVVPQEDGTGTRTITVQSGTVTSVSSSRLSVRSTDGFTATYVVNSSTRLAGVSGGISAVKKDHQVVVVASKSGSTLTAIRVGDRTLRAQQRPDDDDRAPQAPTPSPSRSTSGARGASA